jgi:hydroxymethylpyrimidine pyrophosphatase-like HAD family hydrolase
MHFTLTTLPKSWFIDLDGTILKHNLEYMEVKDKLLPGVKKFWKKNIHPGDTVILVTNRISKARKKTEQFLKKQGIRYDLLICGLPNGERVCINDIKPSSGLKTAVAINITRNLGVKELTITRNG